MAERKFIDQAGLVKVFELIAGKYETIANVTALATLVGAAAKDNEEAKSILERVAALETLAGNESVASQIAAAVEAEAEIARAAEEANAQAIADEQERAEGAESDLQDAIDAEEAARKAQIGDLGKVGEGDEAVDQTVKGYVDAKVTEANGETSKLAELVGKTTDTKEEETVFGVIAKEIDRATTAEGLNAQNIADEIDRATGVEEDLQAAIDLLNGTDEEDGSVAKAVKDEADRIDAVIGAWSVAGETPVAGTGLRKEIEDKITAINGAAETLEGRVKANEDAIALLNDADTVEGSVAYAVKAEETARIAQVGTLTVADGADATVANAIAYAVAEAELKHLVRQIVDTLPAVAEANDRTIYMVADVTDGTDVNNTYSEWMLVGGKFERIGSTAVNLADYQKTADLVALTNDEIAKLFKGESL